MFSRKIPKNHWSKNQVQGHSDPIQEYHLHRAYVEGIRIPQSDTVGYGYRSWIDRLLETSYHPKYYPR